MTRGLQRQLEELEQTDPAVGAAAKKYAETVAEITDKTVVTIETTTEPDGMGRQRFSVQWWDEDFYLGPRWRGQVYFCRVDDFLAMPGRPEGRVLRRHRPETR
jgi:hypothetical protein